MAEVHHLKDHRQTIQEALEDECAVLHDQLAGAEKDVRAWRMRYANLKRDVQAESEADPLWPLAVRLFKYHQRVCGHLRAEWTPERFRMVRRLLSSPDGLERALRAISGCMADAWRVEKGLTMFEDVFESTKKFERCLSRCPKNWQPPPGYEKAPQPEG